MSIEREGKILNVDKDVVIKRILELGGTYLFSGIISGEYYKQGDTKLRVREEQRGIVVCLKKKTSNESLVKIREEIEVVVDNKENLLKIFQELGIKETRKIEKERLSYLLNGCHIDIDTYSHIPTLLEIEGNTDEEIIEIAKNLGFKKEDITDYSFSELEKLYQKKKIGS